MNYITLLLFLAGTLILGVGMEFLIHPYGLIIIGGLYTLMSIVDVVHTKLVQSRKPRR